MVEDEADGSCQVLAGGLCAGVVNESEGVVALLGKLQRMREAVLHGAHIGKSTACIADGELLAGDSLEEKQSGIFFGRVSRLFLVGVDVIEDGLAVRCPLSQGVHDLHRFVWINMAVVGQLKFFQSVAAVIILVRWKQQPPEAVKGRSIDDIFDFCIAGKGFGFILHGFVHFLVYRARAASGQE